MKFIPVQTRILLPPRDNIFEALDTALPRLREEDILFITSKVLAIHQGRCIPVSRGVSKEHLIRQESDAEIPARLLSFRKIPLTLKEHTLIPAAGIDESNGNGYYILWPRRIDSLLAEIRRHLQRKFKIKKLAVVATDSHTMPVRKGVIGISIGSCGMEPLRDRRGAPDIFGRKLQYTQVNVVDALAAAAVLLMGESNERTPFLIARAAPGIQFTDASTRRKLFIHADKDLYTPLLRVFRKAKHV